MTKKNYETVLLDWDGNIARTLDVWLGAYRSIVEKRGIVLSDAEIIDHFFGHLEPSLAKWGHSETIEALGEELSTYALQRLPDVELYPNTIEVLRELKACGKKLALITTSVHQSISGPLDKYELRDLFDVIVAGDDVSNHKPHPEPLFKALSELDADITTAVMVGDSDKDIGAARNAGVDSILFFPPEHAKYYELDHLRIDDPTYIVSDFADIREIICGRAAETSS